MENANSPEYLEKIKNQLIENLRRTVQVPSVQMQNVPRHSMGAVSDEEDAELDDLDEDENKDVRMTQRRWEQQTEQDNEYEESDNEELEKANGVIRNGSTRPAFHDYRNSDVEIDSGVQTPVNGSADNIIKSKETDEVVMEDVDAKEPEPEVETAAAKEPEAEVETETSGIAEQEGALKEAQEAAQSERNSSEGDKTTKGNDKSKDATPKGDDEVMKDADDKPTEAEPEKPEAKEPEASKKEADVSEQLEKDNDGDVDMGDVPTAEVEAKASDVKKEDESVTTTTKAATDDTTTKPVTEAAGIPKDSASSS